MSLIYGSVCSGIEAASVAWEPLGWRPAFFSEIEPFPSAVLAARFGSNMPDKPLAKNGVPNHGDFTKIGADAGPIDLLVGGTPCQSFSIAGKRLGLDDPRGNLAIEYLALARRLRARWFVWENVPGVLSSRSGDGARKSGDASGPIDGTDFPETSDFATFLSFVRECGYGFAYRILDAQYVRVSGFERAVPQRRRRMFVVGYLGDWRPAAAVLFEPDGVPGHPAPRRQAGQGASPTLSARTRGGGGLGTDFEVDGGLIAADVASTLNAAFGSKLGLQDQHINSGAPLFVAHALRGEGFDASEDGTGRGTPIVPVCFDSKGTQVQTETGGVAPTLRSMAHANSHQNAGGQLAVAFDMRGRDGGAMPEGPHDTANIRAASGGSSRSYVAQHAEDWAVRRLTPRECERLQGFPDDWTRIPWRGKADADCPDGPRYKACGNSMAVNVMRWIGERIDLFEELKKSGAFAKERWRKG